MTDLPRAVASTPDIDALIAANAPVVIGVSGGKDSQAAALAVSQYLDAQSHKGERVLIHADLGVVEWNDSLPACERLARHLGLELVILRRAAGDMMDRWEARWESSQRRYASLETVTLVLPFSTPGMRFCTSELKTHPIESWISSKKWKGQTVINVTGLRREESRERAKKPIASLDEKKRLWAWRPIIEWKTNEVFAFNRTSAVAEHMAYQTHSMTRVSCRFCIMSSIADLQSAASAPESHDLYRRMVALEIKSTFGFQSGRWLGNIAPHLLTEAERAAHAEAKEKARRRSNLESTIVKELLYASGWPVRLPTYEEAANLANVRTTIARDISLNASFLTASSIISRFAELMAEKEKRAVLAGAKTARLQDKTTDLFLPAAG